MHRRGSRGTRPAVGRLHLDRPEGWPQSVAAAGELDGVPVLATGSVDGAVWVWDRRTLSPTPGQASVRAHFAGPFVQLPPYVLEQGWDLLYVKPNLEQATSVALGNVPEYGESSPWRVVGRRGCTRSPTGRRLRSRRSASSCPVRGDRIAQQADRAGHRIDRWQRRGWDRAAGTRVAGLYVDDPITDLTVESNRVILRTATHGDYALELKEP